MSESEGPTAGQILIGIFLILFGLCVTLVGGGCTIMWVVVIFDSGDLSGAVLLLVSLAVLAGGLGTLWVGGKFLLGKYRT